MRAVLALPALALGMLLLGCTDESRTTAPTPGPGAAVPEQFSDIPLPRGYVFRPEADQLTVSLAGGSVRRFDVWLIQRDTAEPQPIPGLLGEMERELTTRGWKAPASSTDGRLWEKGTERLELETGRTGGLTSIRIRLRQAPVAHP